MDSPKILHIFVIGFHHKKGSQLEFVYPKLESLPEQWKNLTSLSLPDGAHNYDHDTVYFHLPSLDEPSKTLFGVSCFQQIPIEKVKNKTSDMTRGAVQKAVAVLSTVPLYGHIQVKMELVTAAFFDEGDFSQVSLLQDAYNHLNSSLDSPVSQHVFDGLSARDFVILFRHKALLLFKLLLLERRVVFFYSPVHPLCNVLLTLVSLHPGLLEFGLYQASSISNSRTSTVEKLKDIGNGLSADDNGVTVNVCKTGQDNSEISKGKFLEHVNDSVIPKNSLNEISVNEVNCNHNEVRIEDELVTTCNGDTQLEEGLDVLLVENYFDQDLKEKSNSSYLKKTDSSETLKSEVPASSIDLSVITNWNIKGSGLPLAVFTKGNLCLPYLSISYLDFLTSNGVRGFVAGATNILFKQKRHLAEVLVELENGRIETQCPDIRKQLTLTTEDLRFSEQLVRAATEPRDVYIPDVGREGGDEWIRCQFQLYMLTLLRTSMLQDGSKEIEHFNSSFMGAWKNTHNYRQWNAKEHSAIWDLNPGHPCAGTLSVNDVRLKISHAMSSSESGRKLNQAVATTGKAVGGAITQAKGALSSWWNNLTTQDNKAILDSKPVEDI